MPNEKTYVRVNALCQGSVYLGEREHAAAEWTRARERMRRVDQGWRSPGAAPSTPTGEPAHPAPVRARRAP